MDKAVLSWFHFGENYTNLLLGSSMICLGAFFFFLFLALQKKE